MVGDSLIPHLSPLSHLSLLSHFWGTALPSGKAAALRAAGECGGPGARRARSLWSRLERRPGDAASRRARRPGPEALSEYARVGWALVLFEIGDRDQSIAEMEDVSIALKGYPGQCVSCIYPPWMHASDLMVLHSINHSVVSIGD